MFCNVLMKVFTFCDDAAEDSGLIHNPYAINEQNSRCDMRSGWSVLRDHKDFARIKYLFTYVKKLKLYFYINKLLINILSAVMYVLVVYISIMNPFTYIFNTAMNAWT